MTAPAPHRRECDDPRLRAALTEYGFSPTHESNAEIEDHLLVCDQCWNELRRLQLAVHTLRTDGRVSVRVSRREFADAFGMSSRTDRPFGGHAWLALGFAVAYATLYALATVIEVVYQLDRYGNSVRWQAPLAFTWMLLSTAGVFGLTARAVAFGRRRTLWLAAGVFIAAPLILYLGLLSSLADAQTVQASFQTYTARSGYLKSVGYFLLLGLSFALLPWHAVLCLQRELRLGRHRAVLRLLTRDPLAISPIDAVVLRTRLLVSLLIGFAGFSYVGLHFMFSRLTPGPYTGLFTTLVLVRVGLWLATAAACIGWYRWCLNEIKRECLMDELESTSFPDGSDPMQRRLRTH